MRPLPTLLTLALAAAFGGFVASAINVHLDNRAEAAPASLVIPATAALPASVAGQPVPSLAPMLERAMPAVVSVNTKQVVRVRNPFFNDPFFRRLFPDVPQERINESLGSGVIIDANAGDGGLPIGYLLYHLRVDELAQKIADRCKVEPFDRNLGGRHRVQLCSSRH